MSHYVSVTSTFQSQSLSLPLFLCICISLALCFSICLSVCLSVSLSPWLPIFVSLALSQADNRPFFLCSLKVTYLQFQNYEPLVLCLPTISLQKPFSQRKNDDLGSGSTHLHTFAMHTETRLKIWHTDKVLCVLLQCVALCCSTHIDEVITRLSRSLQMPSKDGLNKITKGRGSFGLLQCVAVRCSALQCVAVCYSALQCVAIQPTDDSQRCSTLQHTATHCNTLQHTATHCNTQKCFNQNNKRCLYTAIGSAQKINSLSHTHTHTHTHAHTHTHTRTHTHTYDTRKMRKSVTWRDVKWRRFHEHDMTWRRLHERDMVRLIHMRALTHSSEWHDSFICVTW